MKKVILKTLFLLIFLVFTGGLVWINWDSAKALSKGYILKWKAIDIATEDFQRDDNVSNYKISAMLREDEWVVSFIYKKNMVGNGTFYCIDARTGNVKTAFSTQ